MKSPLWLLLVFSLVVWSGNVLANVPAPKLIRQFRAEDARPGDDFGRAIALDGRLAIIGAPRQDVWGEDSGAAYLFDVLSGQQLHKLVPQDGAAEDAFGISVSIKGNLAIVGAMDDDDSGRSSGSAYLFDVSTGQQVHKLTALDASPGVQFGVAVDLEDDIAIVGAYKDGPGSAYVFDVGTGQQLRKLRADDASPDDYFGVELALDGDFALIGAPYDDDPAFTAGAAYLFNVHTGQQLQKFVPADGDWGDRHGWHLDLEGDRAIVASRYDDDAIKSSGSAYIYDTTDGSQRFKIVADDQDPSDHFGSAVSADGNLVLIGAVFDDRPGIGAGSAYLFDVQSGEQLYKLTAPDPQILDQFGQSVAIDGDLILIGAPMLDSPGAPGLPSGKAYVFQIPEPSSLHLLLCACVLFGWRGDRRKRNCIGRVVT